MPKVTEILVRKEHNGQVWWELKPVEVLDEFKEKTRSSLEPARDSLPKSSHPVE